MIEGTVNYNKSYWTVAENILFIQECRILAEFEHEENKFCAVTTPNGLEIVMKQHLFETEEAAWENRASTIAWHTSMWTEINYTEYLNEDKETIGALA